MLHLACHRPPLPILTTLPMNLPIAGLGAFPTFTPSVGLLGALAVGLGALVYVAVRPSRSYTPNRSRRSKLPRTCRSGPPKRYPKDRKKYALPECWMYPVHDRPHVRKAAQRFGKHRLSYSPAVRKKIAAKIDQAKRRFGIGEYRR